MRMRNVFTSARQGGMTLIDFVMGVIVASIVSLALALVLSLDRAF